MKVRTFFYEFEVIFADRASEEWVNPPPGVGEQDSGYTDFDHERIVVRSDLSPSMQADCVLHEALHVACEAGGAAEGVKLKEEQWVCNATAGLKQLLTVDNDELFEYLGVNL
jgi:hypothetical protein